MKAFILTDKDGQIRDKDMLDLYDGFLYHNIKTQFYKSNEMLLGELELSREDIVLGHVQMCMTALKHLKIEEPASMDYPSCLSEFLGRKIQLMESYKFNNLLIENEEFGNTYFVKPLKNKNFTGFTCCTSQEFKRNSLGYSSSGKVYVSSIVNFEDEYRVYIYKDEVKEVHHYLAKNWKPKHPLDYNVIEKMVEATQGNDMPVFYSIDVGVTDDGKTLLVECNDGYALGNYGLAPCDYAKMSMERWQQIVNKV